MFALLFCSKIRVFILVFAVVVLVIIIISDPIRPSLVRLLNHLLLLFVSIALGLADKPVKDRMRVIFVLWIISQNKPLLLHTDRIILTIVIKELLRFAFGRESCNHCLLLSFNLFLGLHFFLLLWCTESLFNIGWPSINEGVNRGDEFLALNRVKLCWGVGERIVTCYYWCTAQTHLLLRVCCVLLRVFATEFWKVVFPWVECCLSREKRLLSWRLLVNAAVVLCHFWILCLMMLNEFARFLVG